MITFAYHARDFTLDEVVLLTLSRFPISRRYCILKFVFPARTLSRHAAVPPARDEGAFTLLSNFRSPVSGLRSPVSKFSTFYFSISTLSAKTRRGFTLLELLVVIAIIAILMVLIVPAFTTIKAGNDVTAAAYTIKGVLDQACTYAKANNTYTWVGFFEENVVSTTPGTAGVGRLVMSTVASKDGTIIYDPTNLARQDLTTSLIQVGKLTKIDNVHLWTHTDTPSGTTSTFDARPNVATTYCIGDQSPSNSTTPFQYPVGNPAPTAQYAAFVKAVQFSPGGEARIDNSTVNANGSAVYPLQTAAEIGLEPTHGNVAPSSIPANVVAIQFTGGSGDVKIYRR